MQHGPALHDVATGRYPHPTGVHTEFTIDASQVKLTGIDADLAKLCFLGGPVRYTLDGQTAPASGGPGFLGFDEEWVVLNRKEVNNFVATREGSVNGTLQVQPYKKPHS